MTRIAAIAAALLLAIATLAGTAAADEGDKPPRPDTPTFGDVDTDHHPFDNPGGDTYAGVEWGEDQGVSQGGFNDGTWRPHKLIRREAVMRWLFNYHFDVAGEQFAAKDHTHDLDVEADGPYAGATNLTDGDNSDDTWDTDGKQTAWVRCPDGKTAVGGGFGNVDGNDDYRITTSVPAVIDADGTVSSKTGGYIGGAHDQGLPDNSIVDPNGWYVEGYVDSGTVTMRPHVICIAGASG